MNEELVTFAEIVRKMSNQIASKCLGGRMAEAGELACELSQIAADVKADMQMRQEKKDGYNLADLQVNLDAQAPE